ncbi:major facilitator superfamily domain-containing protein [Mycena sp. CBHHK59/15]|nr:major facilitator superfamily domain-containing protein [Mycena sp. CBHHK59/15]
MSTHSNTAVNSFAEPNTPEISKEKLSTRPSVALDPHENPENLPLIRKWLAVVVIGSGSLCVTCASSMASFTETGLAKDFHVSHEITILSISLFVEGLGIGPLLAGPISEVYGRTIVYRISYLLLVLFSFPVAFAPNIEVFLIFRFLMGCSGSSFLSVAGGSVADMFSDATVANPMALYTITPFLGPVLACGVQNLLWRWTYRILLIWMFFELVAIFLLVPESYVPVLLQRKAHSLRKTTGDGSHWAPLDRRETTLLQSLLMSCYIPFELLFLDKMALLLDLWTALILGILYLAFQAFPFIFGNGHHFNMQMTGLTFLGIGIGMLLGLSSQPHWNRVFAKASEKHGGVAPPETRLLMGQLGAIIVPISLFWLAFTTYPSVPWIVPILASVPFGAGIFFVFTSTFTYLVTAYRPVAASALAANSVLRMSFGAVFPLFADAMYDRLGTVGATALLAGLTVLVAPLPFIFYRIGPQLRAKSRFASH